MLWPVATASCVETIFVLPVRPAVICLSGRSIATSPFFSCAHLCMISPSNRPGLCLQRCLCPLCTSLNSNSLATFFNELKTLQIRFYLLPHKISNCDILFLLPQAMSRCSTHCPCHSFNPITPGNCIHVVSVGQSRPSQLHDGRAFFLDIFNLQFVERY